MSPTVNPSLEFANLQSFHNYLLIVHNICILSFTTQTLKHSAILKFHRVYWNSPISSDLLQHHETYHYTKFDGPWVDRTLRYFLPSAVPMRGNPLKFSGVKLSGRKLCGRKLSGRKLFVRILSERKLSGLKLFGRKLSRITISGC